MTNLEAFLQLIRTGEGTLGDAGYRTLYGGGHFDSFADHPRQRVTAGGITSSAAGAYQILEKTWDGLVSAHPELTDFGPSSQDKAALFLIKGRGAYDDVVAGRFVAAIGKCNREWASLPGSPYGQPTLTMARAMQILTDAGAQFAPAFYPATVSQEPTMDPLSTSIITTAIPALWNAIPEIAQIFKKPDVAARNVEAVQKVGQILIDSTQSANAQEAVTKVQADKGAAQTANEAIRLSRADIMDMLDRLNEQEQKNIAAARTYNSGEPLLIDTAPVKMKFWQILAIIVVLCALGAMGYVLAESKDVAERTMVLQVLLLGGFSVIMQFVFGSSDGSKVKDFLKK